MNKRRRFKAKARRRLIARTKAILLVNDASAKVFLAERLKVKRRVDPYRATRQLERMLPRSVFHEPRIWP